MEGQTLNEDLEKQQFINENIIEKGYNPEELNAFIVNRRAGSIEEISLSILKEEVEAFKNSLLEDAYISIKKTMPITKRDEQLSDLYSNQTFKVNYLPLPECELAKLEKEGKKIKVKISNGKFEKVGGIFSSQIKYTCSITCDELKSNVKRTIDDVEWLKAQLNEKYPLIYVPPLYSKDKNKNEKPNQQTRFIIRFFNAVLRKKLLRISPILYDFITLDNSKFKKFKDTLNKNKYTLDLKMENFKSTKESEEFQFTKQQIYLPEKYLEKFNLNIYNTMLEDLNKSLLEVAYDLKNLSTHTKDLSNIFGRIYTHAQQAEQTEKFRNTCLKFKNALAHWSESFEKQSLFFGLECKEFFTFVSTEINEMNVLYSQYNKYREDYEKLGIQLFEKKEKLFAEKQYDKWELSKEDEARINEFKNNFNQASLYMCKETSDQLASQKLRVACSCNIVLRELKKVDKYLGEQLEVIFNSFKTSSENAAKEQFNETLYKT